MGKNELGQRGRNKKGVPKLKYSGIFLRSFAFLEEKKGGYAT